MARIVILGGGFGGIAAATELRRRLDDSHEIVVLDRREAFFMGLRKLWQLVDLGTIADGSRSRRQLEDRDIRFHNCSVTGIDPAARRVVTDTGNFEADFLVVALGAEPRADLVPGMTDHAHNAWDSAAIPGLTAQIQRFDAGRIAIVIAGAPYKCPPAPYECAMLLDDHLRATNRRAAVQLMVSTLQPMLLPNAGAAGSAWLGEQLAERDIGFQVGKKVWRFEAGRVVFADESTLEADLLIGIPPHKAPAVVAASGLLGDGEWVTADPGTCTTAFPNVYAIGDVTRIPLANGLPLPKAGLFAEAQGVVVAREIASSITGAPPPDPYDGTGYCFIEMGRSAASRVEGVFYAEPEPVVTLQEPSGEHAAAKRLFEAERLEKWFGV